MLALTRFEARVFLVNDVNAAFAANYTAVFVAGFGGFERAEDFHKHIQVFKVEAPIYPVPVFLSTKE
jgi:hypothetical protein